MKTSVDVVSGVERKINVEIPADEVSRRVEEEFVELRKVVPLKGFRKGKAPLDMVKRLFRESVEAEVSERLMKEALADVVKEKELKVLSMGGVDGAKLVPGRDFVFSATVEVIPEVAAASYKGIPVAREKVSVSDGDVDAAVERLRESLAQFHAVEGRGAAGGDLAEFSFTATSGGVRVDGNESASVVLSGGVPFGADFERSMLGVVPGDSRTFEVFYPAEHSNPKLAGKKVAFDVKVAGVKEKKLPALDEEFAKIFGEVSGLGDLKEKMRDRLRAEAEERSRQRAEEDLRKGLVERNAFDVPATLVKRQTMAMMQDTFQRLASQGLDLKKMNLDVDKMSERFAPNAERMVRVSLLIDAIAKAEGMDVSFSEIDAEMKAMAEAGGMEYEKVRELYGSEERLDSLRDRLLERKVMAFLLSNADSKEVAPE
ncbi:MAG: trigger factor [Deltaproteobacteria bacterium]|nr:MAG: trigger factor [Deltaproteobacteria bacterium]